MKPSAAPQLPAADPTESRHSRSVIRRIREEIEDCGGAIPFSRYMQLALHEPGLGYYSAGARKFGAAGDFVTAPEVSSLFAKCLARQCRQVLESMGGGDVLELGAGSGRMAADLMMELEGLGSPPRNYLILEPSAELRTRQRATLAACRQNTTSRIEWVDTLPEEGFRGVVLANEVVDAMPVHRFRVVDEQVLEQFVTWTGNELATGFRPTTTEALHQYVAGLQAELGAFPAGYESEANLLAGPWMKAIADCMGQGVALVIDYGYPRSEYYHPQRTSGTLMCHYRHRAHPDPFYLPGLQDITAYVDFTFLAQAGENAGLELAGYTTQAHFLLACGLDELVASSNPEDPRSHLPLMQEVKKLTLPSEMGERFKVLALSRGFRHPLMGMQIRDLRARL